MLLVGRELLAVRSFLRRGVTPERFAEAIHAIDRADPATVRSRWGAVCALVRDTKPGVAMEWGRPMSNSNAQRTNAAGSPARSAQEILAMRTPEGGSH